MKKLVCLVLISSPTYAVRTSKEMTITYRITEQSSPSDKHKRSKSYPGNGDIFIAPEPLQLMPPVPHNTLKDPSLDEISITIPKEEDVKPTMEQQIQAITNEDKKSNGNPCTPTRLVVVGSIFTAFAGVVTAVVTATVTLIVHFTTK